MQTAEEILNTCMGEEIVYLTDRQIRRCESAMLAFAKMHVSAALTAAAKNINGSYSEGSDGEFTTYTSDFDILDAYPVENII